MLFFALGLARLVASDQQAYLSEFQSHLALLAQRALARRMDRFHAELEPWVNDGKLSFLAGRLPNLIRASSWDGDHLVASFGEGEKGPLVRGTSAWALLPINDSGVRWIGRYDHKVVELDLQANWLDETFDEASGATLQLVGAKGEVLYHPGIGSTGISGAERFPAPSLLKNIDMVRTLRYDTPAGDAYLGTFLTLATDPPVWIVVSSPWSAVRSVVRHAYRQSAWISACLLLIAIATGWFFSMRLTAPLRELGERMRQVGKGELGGRLKGDWKRTDEVGNLANSFHQMVAELRTLREEVRHKERLAALGEFSAAIAHEIKNPLTGVLSNAQLIRRQLERPAPDRPAVMQALTFVEEETKRAGGIVSSLMKFARQEHHPKDKIDLTAQVRHSMELLQGLIAGSGVNLVNEVKTGQIFAIADAGQIHEVVVNLVQNAIQAMRESPEKRLCVGLMEEGDNAVLRVEDSGLGFSKEARTHLFEPFYTTKPPGEGTGLGLSICHGIILSHGGQI
jgi:signal transduction histidine kinase